MTDREKANERQRKWRAKNAEKVQQQRKAIRDNPNSGYREHWNEYYAKNREKIIARTKEYRIKNPEVTKESAKRRLSVQRESSRKKREELKPDYIVALIAQYDRKHGNRLSKEQLAEIRKDQHLIEAKTKELVIKRIEKMMRKLDAL